jgi:undecaprenol kinase
MSAFFKSFVFAIRGIGTGFGERNFRLHLLAFITVLAAGLYFKIEKYEWLIILGMSALVLSLELVNTAIERLCDLYSKEQDERIKKIKDLAAGAVLIAAILAAVIGLIIFNSYIQVL